MTAATNPVIDVTTGALPASKKIDLHGTMHADLHVSARAILYPMGSPI